MDIFALMDAAYSRGASDLHVSVGRRPVLRLGGGLVEIGDAVITPEDTVAMAKAVAPQRNYEELERGGTTDFGFAFGDKCRFRVSLLTQKGSRGIV
ncbi:MAG: type IV pili twitching motility protein PilT, partial [Planctomycetes bacterium]|nr:type IV pili twitching motility protein PilT [Planctomycetota bacterium]